MGWAWEGLDKEVTSHRDHLGAAGIGEGAGGGREVENGGEDMVGCGRVMVRIWWWLQSGWEASGELLGIFWRAGELEESIWGSSKDFLETSWRTSGNLLEKFLKTL